MVGRADAEPSSSAALLDADSFPTLGLTFRSEGHRIQARSRFSLPISVSEPSVIRIDWQETEGAELEFSASFTQAGLAVAHLLVAPARLNGHPGGLVEVNSPGVVCLIWENVAVFQTRNVKYSVALVTRAELEAEEDRQEELLVQRRRDEAKHREAQRRAARDAKIDELQTLAAADLEAGGRLRESCVAARAALEALRAQLIQKEAEHASVEAEMERLEQSFAQQTAERVSTDLRSLFACGALATCTASRALNADPVSWHGRMSSSVSVQLRPATAAVHRSHRRRTEQRPYDAAGEDGCRDQTERPCTVTMVAVCRL